MKVLSYKLYAQALVSATVMFALFATSFLFLEPTVGRAASSTFTVSQTITAELSIAVASSSLTMNGAIAGITGGTSNGETDVIVTTNNAAGYNMTIQFSSSTAMYLAGGGTGSDSIKNYATTTVADRTFIAQTYAQFAFSAYSATDAADIDATFLDNGSICGAGSTSGTQTCWLAPSSTAADLIVTRTSATLNTGATTTVQFRVNVPNNPNPAVPTGIYTATATLTAVTN